MLHKFEIRKFNAAGVKAFRDILETRPAKMFEKLEHLSEDDSLTVKLDRQMEWDSSWTTRRELAACLWKHFGIGEPLEREAADAQVFNWLACKLFPILHAGNEKTVRANKRESSERWIMTETTLRQHRHRISGPFVAFKNNHEDLQAAESQLVQKILEPGEVVERIAGKLELSQGSVALLTTWLYVDGNTHKIRQGITGLGEPQQLSKYFNQIQKTVDYESMPAKDLLAMLPSQFSKWRKLAEQDWDI